MVCRVNVFSASDSNSAFLLSHHEKKMKFSTIPPKPCKNFPFQFRAGGFTRSVEQCSNEVVRTHHVLKPSSLILVLHQKLFFRHFQMCPTHPLRSKYEKRQRKSPTIRAKMHGRFCTTLLSRSSHSASKAEKSNLYAECANKLKVVEICAQFGSEVDQIPAGAPAAEHAGEQAKRLGAAV